ncbi:MAG: two-component system sensor histidine kinase ChiS [Gammaproteobacteria bacterium]|jgi:two-component system sensor histidine kinase ChiS
MDADTSILIVDDTPDTIRLISSILKDRYHVRVARSGQRGIELALQNMPGIILLDVEMPEMDGYETCRVLKDAELTREIPVIFLTGRAAEEDERRGLQIGAADYITKPISPAILLARIETQLRLKQATDLLRDQNELLEHAVEERTRELTMTNRALSRFVPDEFLAELGHTGIRDAKLGDHVHSEMTVMFSDIRGYTTLAETLTPQEAFDFINEHLGRVGPVIRAHNGLIAQFYGDGIMTVFPRSAADGIRAAVAMQREVQAANERRKRQERAAIAIGIGLNTGPLTIGIIGYGERTDTGVVGDAVNTAARMEELTKSYGARIICSENVRSELGDEFLIRFLDRVQVRGKKESLAVYEIFDADDPWRLQAKLQTLEVFETGQEHFAAERFADAVKCFSEVLKIIPDDRPTQLRLERSAHQLVRAERQ